MIAAGLGCRICNRPARHPEFPPNGARQSVCTATWHNRAMVFAAANSLVRILLAPVCAACRRVLSRPLEGSVCAECWMAVPRLAEPICDLCGDALPSSRGPFRMCGRCLMSPPAFEAARSAGIYAGSLRALIHAFKYRSAPHAGSAACVADAGGRRRSSQRRGRGRAGAAAPSSRAAPRFQSGRRPGSSLEPAGLASIETHPVWTATGHVAEP